MLRSPSTLMRSRKFLVIATMVALNIVLGILAADAQSGRYGKKSQQGTVRAFADNEKSVLPRGTKVTAQQLSTIIDQEIDKKLKLNEIQASGQCTDAEFIRRVYLDIVGVIPSPEKAQQFLDSKAPDKRARLIDELLENPWYGKYFAEIWINSLVPRVSNNRRLQTDDMQDWLSEQFNRNRPWNEIVTEIITADGPITENSAVTFFVGNPTPDKITDKVCQNFLGVQLQCAQCHNHPFTDYKQEEYWAMAAFFMKTRVVGNPNLMAKKGKVITVSEFPKAKVNKRQLPESAKFVPARFLSDEEPRIGLRQSPREVLAKWITSKENRYFSRAITNKMWFHFFGRGFVNPPDDMHEDNPASHPELLATLAEQLKEHDFDLKYLIRAICNSQTYQRSSRPVGNNADDKELFSHAQVRMLSPEQLYDSLDAVLQFPTPKVGPAKDKKQADIALLRPRNPQRDQFIAFFSTDSGFNPLEYQAGIPQALRLMNSRQINTQPFVNGLIRQKKTQAQVIEYMYLATLSRRPTDQEYRTMIRYLRQQGQPRIAYGDMLWALLNSSEFMLNH